jgi:DNA invertase Pin-like site-specific DNA recombinase
MDAIIYAAKSTDDKKGSIARQLKQCHEMAATEKWTVVGEHEDENKSTANPSH